MKVLVTGSNGFVGKNLRSELTLHEGVEVFCYDKDSTLKELDKYTKECDFVFHLAGVNRPQDPKEFMEGNFGFTSTLLDKLKEHKNKAPIMISSSIQAELDNDYGKSKKAGEDLIFKYGKDNKVKVYVYRFPNLFGKWCRPNYNSVIATFCNNVATNQEIVVNDESKELTLAYIDDVCEEIVKCLNDNPTKEGNFCKVPITYTRTLGYIANLIKSFKENFKQGIPEGLLFYLMALVTTVDLWAMHASDSKMLTFLMIVISIIAAFLIVVFVYIFALQSRYENTVKETILNAFKLAVGNLPRTVLMMAIWIIWIGAMIYFHRFSLLVFIIYGLTLPGYLCTMLYDRVFVKLEETE